MSLHRLDVAVSLCLHAIANRERDDHAVADREWFVCLFVCFYHTPNQSFSFERHVSSYLNAITTIIQNF